MASQSPTDSTDKAINILCAKHFHRAITLDVTNSHERLRVTFSTTSNFDNTSLPTVLFIGPMFCSRWHAVDLDTLASEYGVRVICSDRPAMGGSTAVPIAQRMQVVLETIPALLKTLNVEFVSLMTHSAGTLYTLNTLSHLRNILDPKRPFVAFIAPFVHTRHSDAPLTTIAARLPSGMIESFDGLHRFVQSTILPTIGWSGGISSSIGDMFQTPPAENGITTSEAGEKYGVDKETAQTLTKLMRQYMLAENTSATNEEILMCLQKAGPATWGVAEDYEKCMRDLAIKESDYQQASPQGNQPAKLHVKAYFAPSDVMIGNKGREFFEKCWRQEGISDMVNFESAIVPDTNHDSIIADYKKTAIRLVFEDLQKIYNHGV